MAQIIGNYDWSCAGENKLTKHAECEGCGNAAELFAIATEHFSSIH
jgi:hypothetical protein